MTLRRLLRSIVALTVAAGLMSAPAATTAFGKPDAALADKVHAMDTHAMNMHATDVHAADSRAAGSHAADLPAIDSRAMPGDMPCCPDEGNAGDCACPLFALCMLSISIPLPAGAAALATRDPQRQAFSARDDARVQGLAGRPPDHPPRTMI